MADALVAVGVDVSERADLQPFPATCLHPGRTLVEKIMILNSKVDASTTREQIVATRMARHFYDIHELLGDDRVLELLRDRDGLEVIIEEHLAVSESFGGSAPRPPGGFAEAYAFNATGAHRDVLQDAYAEGIEALYYGTAADLPSWTAIEDRVHGTSELL